jgi:ribose-phosphate pyrophosphokinase
MSAILHAFRDQAAEAQRLALALRVPLAFVDVHTFPDGEVLPRIPPAASTTIVYRSLNQPNARLVELLLSVDAWRSNGVERLVLVAPYLPYMRQDLAFRSGEPVSQRVLAGLLGDAFDQIVTVDPHLHRTPSLEALFPNCECVQLYGADALVSRLRTSPPPPETLVVGPDVESRPWVTRIAEPLGLDHATYRKVRRGDADVEIESPSGLAIAGRPILLVDDICSTGGTLRKATTILRSSGAASITVFVTHMLGDATVAESVLRAGATRIISTDSCAGPTSEIYLADLVAQSLRGLS